MFRRKDRSLIERERLQIAETAARSGCELFGELIIAYDKHSVGYAFLNPYNWLFVPDDHMMSYLIEYCDKSIYELAQYPYIESLIMNHISDSSLFNPIAYLSHSKQIFRLDLDQLTVEGNDIVRFNLKSTRAGNRGVIVIDAFLMKRHQRELFDKWLAGEEVQEFDDEDEILHLQQSGLDESRPDLAALRDELFEIIDAFNVGMEDWPNKLIGTEKMWIEYEADIRGVIKTLKGAAFTYLHMSEGGQRNFHLDPLRQQRDERVYPMFYRNARDHVREHWLVSVASVEESVPTAIFFNENEADIWIAKVSGFHLGDDMHVLKERIAPGEVAEEDVFYWTS